jgi:fused signal recognition particle receptor
VAIGVACDVGLPVKMIGVGEAVEDLRPFSPQDFVDSIL